MSSSWRADPSAPRAGSGATVDGPAPGPSRGDVAGRLLAGLPAAAAATAEGAWVAVWYAAFAGASAAEQGAGQGDGPALTLGAFVAAAAVGLVAARRFRATTERGPTRRRRAFAAVATAVIVGGAAVLGLVAEQAPGTGDLIGWLGSAAGGLARGETGGLFLGLAVWRGTRHGDPETDDLVTAGLVGWGTPLLAVPWLVGGLRPGPGFAAVALLDTLTFAAAGLVAVGLTRLEALDRSVGLDWRGNRAWLALLVAVAGGTTLVALPAALVVGASLEAIGAALASPAAAAARAAGRIVGALGGVGGSGGGSGPASGGEVGGSPSGMAGVPDVSVPSVVVGLAAVMFALGLVVVAYRLWLRVRGGRPSPEPAPTLPEERRIRFPRPAVRFAMPGLGIGLGRRGRGRPATATEAYLDLVARLGTDSPAGRRPSESPAAHARRLRRAGVGSLRLDLLAADVALERFGDRRLPAAELRRARERARNPRLAGDGGAR